MDNLTHSLVGLAAAKSGLERLSPGAATLCVLAANAPDADIVVLLFGDRWTFLHHHRGITHALVGVLALAIILPVLFFLIDLLLSRIRGRLPRVKFLNLLCVSLIVSFTHPLLDWTNSYGIRPLLPWDSTWFYGDLVFIVDPLIWLLLGSACFLLSRKTVSNRIVWLLVGMALTALIVISPRSDNLPNAWLIRIAWLLMIGVVIAMSMKNVGERFGSKVPLTALALVVIYWMGLMFAHSRALTQGFEQATLIAQPNEKIARLAAMPTLANPFAWDCVFETDKATYRFDLKLGASAARTIRYEKTGPELGKALAEARNDRRAKIFLGFARFPVAKLSDQDCAKQTLVQLADLRYTEPGTTRGTFSLEVPIDCPQLLTVNR